jgi:thiol-disulfide isomerase/thioredoxin
MTYSAIWKEWKTEYDSLKGESASKDGREMNERMKELRRIYTHRFSQLAIMHSSRDSWLSCFMWVHLNGVPGPDFDAMMEFMGHRANSVKNKKMTLLLQRIMPELIMHESDCLSSVLSQISQNHSSEGMRGAALYALAARTKWLAERDGSKKGCKQAEILLQKVLDDYPDVSTGRGKNKDNAKRLLEQLRSPIAIGRPAPETKGKDIDGGLFDLADERGKVVVLSFSGHWCVHCRTMHTIEKELLNKYKRQQLAIIEINSDKQEDLKNVSQKIETEGFRWQHVMDGPRGPISKSWHVNAWPTFYILDRKHQIRRRALGNIGQKLIEWVDQLVNESTD